MMNHQQPPYLKSVWWEIAIQSLTTQHCAQLLARGECFYVTIQYYISNYGTVIQFTNGYECCDYVRTILASGIS